MREKIEFIDKIKILSILCLCNLRITTIVCCQTTFLSISVSGFKSDIAYLELLRNCYGIVTEEIFINKRNATKESSGIRYLCIFVDSQSFDTV